MKGNEKMDANGFAPKANSPEPMPKNSREPEMIAHVN
jgi:hypothetical protein